MKSKSTNMQFNPSYQRCLNKLSILLLLVLVTLSACKKDEKPEPQQANRAPGEFTVSTAPDLNSVLVSWTTATDPDGDAVSYMLILEDDTLIEATTDTFFEVMDLEYETAYNGSVIASDLEGLSSAKNFNFTTGVYPNQPPMAFNLLSPVGGTTGLNPPITFTWQAAVDPDGDVVTYEFIIDESPDPQTSFTTGITTTSFSHDGTGLENGGTYYWKVIAHDGNGGETESPLGLITLNNPMTLGTDNPGWADRYSHTVTEFNGKMWLIGGAAAGGTHYGDIWSSEDGVSWTQEMAEAPFGLRAAHAAVVYDDKLWVIAGQSWYTSGYDQNDVWYTEDGVNWTEATAAAAFEPRKAVHALAYGGYMWLFGGGDYANEISNSYSQVWRSSDGVTWELMTDAAPYLYVTQMVVFDNKMWRIAAYNDDRVFSSTDGVTWNLEQEQSPFGERNAHTCAVHDGKIWLFSGSDNAINEYYEFPDIWSSEDGINWTLVSSDAGFSAVAFSEALTFNDQLWLLGGGGGYGDIFVTNDVWVLD